MSSRRRNSESDGVPGPRDRPVTPVRADILLLVLLVVVETLQSGILTDGIDNTYN